MKELFKVILAILLMVSALAGEEFAEGFDEGFEDAEEIKHILQPNMLHMYSISPQEAQNIGEIFSKGMFYGRLRLNSFGFRWEEELEASDVKLRENHAIAAAGGSLIYQSAPFYGFSTTFGMYGSQAIGTLDESEAYLYKSGKDLLNRYAVLEGGEATLGVLAQAYLEYAYESISIKAGRQTFESFLTKSNDTKMIPNTFEGVTVTSSDMLGSMVEFAYLTKQKLRDHSDFHHLLAYGSDGVDPSTIYDDESDLYTRYTENDDAMMHRGLTLSKLNDRGIEDRLYIVEVKNQKIENVSLGFNYTASPRLVSSGMMQADYRCNAGDLSIIPGLRVMKQFDLGAGEIGGANLKMKTDGYTDPTSLKSALYGARIDIAQEGTKLRFGYTKVADEGDIIAPWRGFPTGGFTRAMGQYNWYANTKSYMAQFEYEYSGFFHVKVVSNYVVQDFDDKKIGVPADSKVFTLNLLNGFGGESTLYLKTRYAHVMGEEDTVAANGMRKLDPSYDEIRFEINYLF